MKPVVIFALVSLADAHGSLVFPPPRNNWGNIDPANLSGNWHNQGGACPGDTCLWFNQGCWIGCSNCSSTLPGQSDVANPYGAPDCPEGDVVMEPTLPHQFRTFNIDNLSSKGDWTKYHPWRAPGHAPVVDPCGMAGGYAEARGGGGETPLGSKHFARGSKLQKLKDVKTDWLAGGIAEVGWMLGADHGGGYLYSVCPASEKLTEKCFQAHPLRFVGGHHKIRYLDSDVELVIPAMDVSEGTLPAEAAWRRNPIPSCNCDFGSPCEGVNSTTDGGGLRSYADSEPPSPAGFPCPHGTQFPVPFDYGYGQQIWGNDPTGPARDLWAIVDQVRVPQVPGDYVLRWRWDSEQNPQVWTHCADVTVVTGQQPAV